MALEKERVCVTGAGGFVGSWVVKLLLSKDYFVHGTVREPRDEKNAHLYKLEKASENLKLFKADLLDYNSVYSAIVGCSGVFHVASPVPSTIVSNPEVEVIEPAVKGTLNVLKASVEAKVKRVVFVSSGAAVAFNPSWPKDQVMDETCWSDKEYCRTTKNWYSFAKTEAESEALEYGKRPGLNVVSICPTFIFGPILQSTLNASSMILVKLLKEEGCESVDNRLRMIVDVRDVAEASVLLYEKPEVEGRYICTAYSCRGQELVDKLKSIYPNYIYPTNFTEGGEEIVLTSAKLQKLGWSYRPLEETLFDSIESYKKAGILD
ncbi:cinnamoyl-CoA reductase 2-like [Pistacia vera]|uniref:cinnamoyl-CoA reductase 2-like n=1 Tax=Pistacia vera TaxID=55513 RepID=UPI001262D649|nr:cinnamoyl-CoA reductase 2-like [Pistacia vera]